MCLQKTMVYYVELILSHAKLTSHYNVVVSKCK